MKKIATPAFLSQSAKTRQVLIHIGLATLISFSLFLRAEATAVDEGRPIVQFGQPNALAMPEALQGQYQGASATLLPSGNWLLLGGKPNGEAPAGAEAKLYDPKTNKLTALPKGLKEARFGHSATLLPNGDLFVFGGITRSGQIVSSPEYFSLETGSTPFPRINLAPRAWHRATLLADGTLLISGGINSRSQTLADSILVDPIKGKVSPASTRLDKARHHHISTLLPNQEILLWGGLGKNGLPLQQSELIQAGDLFSRIYANDMANQWGQINGVQINGVRLH